MTNERRYNSCVHLLYTQPKIVQTMRHGLALAKVITRAVRDAPDDTELGWLISALFVDFALAEAGQSDEDGLTFGLLATEANQYLLSRLVDDARAYRMESTVRALVKAREACSLQLCSMTQSEVLGCIFSLLESVYHQITDYYEDAGLSKDSSAIIKLFVPTDGF